jgi:hypothetical protein
MRESVAAVTLVAGSHGVEERAQSVQIGRAASPFLEILGSDAMPMYMDSPRLTLHLGRREGDQHASKTRRYSAANSVCVCTLARTCVRSCVCVCLFVCACDSPGGLAEIRAPSTTVTFLSRAGAHFSRQKRPVGPEL